MFSSLGYSALFFLVSVLLLNPLVTVASKFSLPRKINRHRRIIGVASFVYAFFHAFLYIEKKGGSFFSKWLFHPVILPGVIVVIILFFLALTSNQFSIKRMGVIAWKKLHRLVYIAQFLIFCHLFLQGGTSRWIALLVFPVLYALQHLRNKKRRAK
ncbi:ferric reductase-like transmembrane domain-containing protein [Candidatus Bandiella euplotis]|uniref:ferric reductase-like transmembrane domain-containing protein n=1 Tax=Candidatus Bandiella euplotis TaxID=1664265 RepID=UPI002B262326|nr:ferric reductase-like transmembrane domain-containing protein [Candidatus Bandiella woodruffii]